MPKKFEPAFSYLVISSTYLCVAAFEVSAKRIGNWGTGSGRFAPRLGKAYRRRIVDRTLASRNNCQNILIKYINININIYIYIYRHRFRLIIVDI